MNDAFYIAATGMNAQQLQVDMVSNNLSNVSTPAFKKGRVVFQDVVASQRAHESDADSMQTSPAMAGAVGAGVLASAGTRIFEGGELTKTDAAMDLAIHGSGFVEVTMPDGTTAYTRGGTLSVNKDSVLCDAAGHALKANVSLPAGAHDLAIAADGRVSAVVGTSVQPVELGHLDIVDFAQAGGLEALGGGLYAATAQSGDAVVQKAGLEGAGTFAQGYVEHSNVNLIDEMVNLMIAQRGYGLNVKSLQAADEIAGMVNNLIRR